MSKKEISKILNPKKLLVIAALETSLTACGIPIGNSHSYSKETVSHHIKAVDNPKKYAWENSQYLEKNGKNLELHEESFRNSIDNYDNAENNEEKEKYNKKALDEFLAMAELYLKAYAYDESGINQLNSDLPKNVSEIPLTIHAIRETDDEYPGMNVGKYTCYAVFWDDVNYNTVRDISVITDNNAIKRAIDYVYAGKGKESLEENGYLTNGWHYTLDPILPNSKTVKSLQNAYKTMQKSSGKLGLTEATIEQKKLLADKLPEEMANAIEEYIRRNSSHKK